MFNNPFNEEDAASRNKRQQLDHLLRVKAPHERLILAGIGVVLLALGVWVLFGSVGRSVSLDGLLIEPGSRHAVVAAEPGHLMEFLVAPGDRVEPGDPIARQSVPELERETAALRRTRAAACVTGRCATGDLPDCRVPRRIGLVFGCCRSAKRAPPTAACIHSTIGPLLLSTFSLLTLGCRGRSGMGWGGILDALEAVSEGEPACSRSGSAGRAHGGTHRLRLAEPGPRR